MKKKCFLSLTWFLFIFFSLSSRTAFSQNAYMKIIRINIEDSNISRYFWCIFFKTLAKSDNIFIEMDDKFKGDLLSINLPMSNNDTILLINDIPCRIPIASSSNLFIEVFIFKKTYDDNYIMSIVTKNSTMILIERLSLINEKISNQKKGDYFFTIIDIQKAILKFLQKFDASITGNWIRN